ncbi:MAG TPA: LLM class F420-dependent oxidoreductase [Acidimicrobiaceae bacterium]|nr:LLM class F420-dependent oxidoreductase [Acidimicrobiaceae bacterium]
MGSIDVGRVGIWTGVLDQLPSSEAVEWVIEAEQLGYGAVWIPEAVGRDPFVAATRLLGGTSTVKIATGIANIYARDPMTTANAQRTIAEAFPGRFLLGLGVSHQHLVEHLRKHEYSKPLSHMREYLERMRKARYMAVGPQELPDIVLAALGPKMLELAATAAVGAHPYFVPPEHTAIARAAMGPDAALYPEQMAVLDTDAESARATARSAMAIYLGLANYADNLLRLGFTADDVGGGPDGGPSDRLVDAIVVWGTVDDVAARVRAHFDAGADHVCVQVLADDTAGVRRGWKELAPALTGPATGVY